MNKIILKGMMRNIQPSHMIGDIEYDKAELIVPKLHGEEDIFQLRFKKFSNKYTEDSTVELIGNIRSYSEKVENDRNKVHLYVFTYFDLPENDTDTEIVNRLEIDGRICKLDNLRINDQGKQSLHFILANNIISESAHQKLNTYLPCVAFGKTALELSKLNISDKIQITGRFNSRLYKKKIDDNELEIRTAYECIVNDFEKLT